MANAFEAHGLVKRFGATTALAGVDLAAPEGTVLGVLGPNGAGKTTAIRILTTLSVPDSGAARVNLLHVDSPSCATAPLHLCRRGASGHHLRRPGHHPDTG